MLLLCGREHELGAPLWLPRRRAVAACVDRWRFWKIAEHLRIPVAPSLLGADAIGDRTMTLPGPWIVKPRFAGGSTDISRVDDPAELAGACDRIEQPIVQTRVSGRAFTVDVLTDRGGRLAGAVPRWRPENEGGGIPTMDRTFCDPRVTAIAERVVAVYGLTGAANLNGFVTDDDEIILIDVKPRFSAGLSLAFVAGADLIGEYMRGAFRLPIRCEQLQFRPDVTIAPHDAERFAA
jgi:carbamoyl-phosphate synthase large subunit